MGNLVRWKLTFVSCRTMEVLYGWIMRVNIHLSNFYVFDYIVGMFMRFYLVDKTLTWYTTWKIMLLERGAIIWWTVMQEVLLQNFQAVESFQMARMKLWNLKSKGDIHEYKNFVIFKYLSWLWVKKNPWTCSNEAWRIKFVSRWW